jgi:DNA-binding response OmpR family regulator
MLTAARTEEMDKVLGLELGADDYVTKPFGSRELLARIKAVLRRSSEGALTPEIFRFGDVSVDFARHEVSRKGVKINLTLTEFKLLQCLIEAGDRVVSRDEILDEVWGDAIVSPLTIEPHIVHLRQKIEDDPGEPRHILSVRGVGYRLKT